MLKIKSEDLREPQKTEAKPSLLERMNVPSRTPSSRGEPVSMPIIEKTVEEDPHIHHEHWRLDARAKGFQIPAPVSYLEYSEFQSGERFFHIGNSEVKSLSDADHFRYLLACRNADEAVRSVTMDLYYKEYYRRFVKEGRAVIRPPTGLPEKWWITTHSWVQNSSGIPYTVRTDPQDPHSLEWHSTCTHLWVTDVTANREYNTLNRLILLFADGARAAKYIWNTYLPQFIRPDVCINHPLPWPVRVPENLAYNPGSVDGLGLKELAAYLMFLVKYALFPIHDEDALEAVSEWAHDYHYGVSRNPYSDPVKDAKLRKELIKAAMLGQPWIPLALD